MINLRIVLVRPAVGATAAFFLSAAAMASGATSGSGLVILNPTASGALSMTGNSAIQVPSAAVYVNSNSATAVSTVGTA